MSSDIIYCIDTSSLIHLNRLYPRDVFLTLWSKLKHLVNSGRMIAPNEVYKEIEIGQDALFQWARQHKTMFKALNTEQIDRLKAILARFPIDVSKSTPEADPFVVALAAVKIAPAQKSFIPCKCIVITQERPSRGGKARIPDMCKHFGIDCISVNDMFRNEGWKF